MKHRTAIILGIFALPLVAAAPIGLRADDRGAVPAVYAGSPDGGQPSIADITEKALPSVVNISSKRAVTNRWSPAMRDPFFGRSRRPQKRYARSLGSGVIVSTKGYVLTNNHVVANTTDIKVSLSDGRELGAKLIGADPASDLAVLKLEGKLGKLRPIEFGDASALRLGDTVLAIGNPFGVGQTVTKGIVSAKGRGDMGITDYEDFIQTDAAINPGNSGGALINRQGQLVGINTAIWSRTGGYQGIGFAIPTNMARPIMNSLISSGQVARGWLGIEMKPAAKRAGAGARKGVEVARVEKGSPAAKAGLRPDDVIVKVGSKKTRSGRTLRTAIATRGPGKTVKLTFYRDGRKKTANVTLGKLPEPMGERSVGDAKAGIGLRVRPVDSEARRQLGLPRNLKHGLLVTNVDPDGRAAQLLQPGDVILKINNKKVSTAKQLGKLWNKSGRRLSLHVLRDGYTVQLVMTR